MSLYRNSLSSTALFMKFYLWSSIYEVSIARY